MESTLFHANTAARAYNCCDPILRLNSLLQMIYCCESIHVRTTGGFFNVGNKIAMNRYRSVVVTFGKRHARLLTIEFMTFVSLRSGKNYQRS